MSRWMLAKGTARLLDLFRETPRVQIAFNPQTVRDCQSVGGRRIGHGLAAPQRRGAEFLKGAAVQSGYIRLCCLVSHGGFVFITLSRAEQMLRFAAASGRTFS